MSYCNIVISLYSDAVIKFHF